MNYIRESFYRKVAEKRFGLYEEDESDHVNDAAAAAAQRTQKSVIGRGQRSGWSDKVGIGPQVPGSSGDASQKERGQRVSTTGDVLSTVLPAAGAVKALAFGAKTVPKIISAVGATGAAAYSVHSAFGSDNPTEEPKLPPGSNASTTTTPKEPAGAAAGAPTQPAEPKLPPGSNASTTPGTPPKEKSFLDRFKNPGNVPPSHPDDKPTGSTTPTAGEAAAPATNLDITTGAPTPPKPAGDETGGFGYDKPIDRSNPAAKPAAAPPSVRPRPAPSPVSTADTGEDKYGSGNASAGFERGKYAAPDASDNSSGANELRSKQQAVDRGNLEESKSKYMNESITFERFLRKNKYGKNF